ncbi:cell wall-binding repeat-containing protein [Romboutsia sp.]|uniref:cell wall-binding repeat-containing protein n=1 Tax=Romboutsia sp. TaxID=1965302 RepID=UPI003F35B9EF
MMKKKNIAMAMAVATVATSVAPAFAAAGDVVVRTNGFADLIAEVEANFNAGDKTQTYDLGDGVVTIADKDALADFKKAVADMKQGNIIDVTMPKVPTYETADLEDLVVVDLAGAPEKTYAVKVVDETVNGKVEYTYTFTREANKDEKIEKDVFEITVAEGNKQLDFEAPIFKTVNGATTLVGFETLDAVDSNVILSKSVETNKKIEDVFANGKLTQYGVELAELAKITGNGFESAAIETEDNIHTAKFVISERPLKKAFDAPVSGTLEEVFISSTSNAKLVEAIEAIESYVAPEVDNLIAGANRFETAVEISKARFNADTTETTDAVILVGENAIVDGLAAAPLAVEKDAPILYTKKDAIHEKTVEEMDRLFDGTLTGKTVYLVGGTQVISQEIEDSLESKGLTVVRLAGENRTETSLAIAEELNTVTDAFIVGFSGEADAMSISAKAAEENQAIIVSGREGLSKDTLDYVVGKNVTLIGGETSLTANVEKQLHAKGIDTTRLAGKNRQETNAVVIDSLYDETAADAKVYIAKSDVLVDALAAGPLAGENGAPIILATNVLDAKQVEVLESFEDVAEVNQVGKGIAGTVIDKVISLFK